MVRKRVSFSRLRRKDDGTARAFTPRSAELVRRGERAEEPRFPQRMSPSLTLTPRVHQDTVMQSYEEGDVTEARITVGTPAKVGLEKSSSPVEEQSAMERFADRINGAITGFFFKIGLSIGCNPRKWLVGTFLVFLVFASGVVYPGLTNENRGDKLWVPADSQAQDDLKYVDGYYGSEARFGEVIVKPADGGEALRPAIVAAMLTVVARIEAATVQWEGATLTWREQCFKIGPDCVLSHLGQIFSSTTQYDSTASILTAVNTVPLVNANTAMPINLDAIIGGKTNDPNTNAVTSAKSLRISFLTKSHEKIVNGDGVDARGDAFEQVLLDAFNTPVDGVDLSFVVARSFGDEFGNAINGDLGLLQTAFVLILSYAALMLSKWDEGCLGSRVAVTFSGIVAILLATGSAYGICSMFGLFYSPLMNVLPFLLLGVGVDDMFVVINAYDLETRRDPGQTLPIRMGKCLASAGASIAVTSLTDMFAFLIGSNTSLPALRNFCFYAAFGIMFTFFFQVTWFVAWLTIDEWRRAAKRRDVACCFTVPKGACCLCCAPRPDGRTQMGRWMGESLGGFLTNPKAKMFVILAFAAISAGGFAGCALMQIDADVNDFIPGGSYLKEWIADSDSMFRMVGDSIDVYTRDFEVHTATGSATLAAASLAFKSDPYVAEASVVSWIEAFNLDRTSAGAFTYVELFTWLDSPSGAMFNGDVVWKNTTGTAPSEGILVTRIRGNHIKVDSSNDKVKSMDSLRAALAAVPGNENGNIFAFSSSWLNYEQYKAIEIEAIRNISSTMAVMVLIIAFLLVNPKAVLVVCFCLCLIIVNIIGYMHFWDLTLDSVTIIMLVIALGLSVDYAAHIGRAFMEIDGTPDARLKLCLENMGVAVLNGAMSTFLAVLLLGGSQSYVFITFFRQLFLCIVFGLTHGLVLLPVLMSLINPKPFTPGAFGH